MQLLPSFITQLIISTSFGLLTVSTVPIELRQRDIRDTRWIVGITQLGGSGLADDHQTIKLHRRRRAAVGSSCVTQCSRCQHRLTLRNAGLCVRDCESSTSQTPINFYTICVTLINSQPHQVSGIT